jgi:hypothetical protein
MKWVLVIVVLGTAPVKTDLIFNSLSECLDADDTMRAEYARAYNEWNTRTRKDQEQMKIPNVEQFARQHFGILNVGTCIPAAANRSN